MKVKVRIHADPLAVKLLNLENFLDPFSGLPRSELLPVLDKDVKTLDGCRAIIENNIDLIRELYAIQYDLLDRENKLIDAVRKYEPNYGLYSGGVQV